MARVTITSPGSATRVLQQGQARWDPFEAEPAALAAFSSCLATT